MVTYSYVKLIRADQLQNEIEESVISVAISYIDTEEENVNIHFEDELSDEDKTTLDSLVENHTPEPYPAYPPPDSSRQAKINQINTILTNNPAKQAPANAALRAVLLDTFTDEILNKILAAIQ